MLYRFRPGKPDRVQILFLWVRPLEAVKKTRQELHENNPALRLRFKCVQSCLEAGVLRGDAFAISTIALTAALLISLPDFPFGSHRRYAEDVVATTLSGLQNRTIQDLIFVFTPRATRLENHRSASRQ